MSEEREGLQSDDKESFKKLKDKSQLFFIFEFKKIVLS